jgi:hypothetical protein
MMLATMFIPFGFIVPKTLDYLAFQSFYFERTRRRSFQKRVVRTKFDIYLCFYYYIRFFRYKVSVGILLTC